MGLVLHLALHMKGISEWHNQYTTVFLLLVPMNVTVTRYCIILGPAVAGDDNPSRRVNPCKHLIHDGAKALPLSGRGLFPQRAVRNCWAFRRSLRAARHMC